MRNELYGLLDSLHDQMDKIRDCGSFHKADVTEYNYLVMHKMQKVMCRCVCCWGRGVVRR